MSSDGKEGSHIEVHTSDKASLKARQVASGLESLFNGPMFALLVRNAVEEMILEGKLEYDIANDTIDIPVEVTKRWAVRMESRYWSRRKRSKAAG
jgi:hypothetical protein